MQANNDLDEKHQWKKVFDESELYSASVVHLSIVNEIVNYNSMFSFLQ